LGNTLYGAALFGGTSGYGVVFAVNTDGTGFTSLHSFNGGSSDGVGTRGGLTLSGNTLYGTGRGGPLTPAGDWGSGAVFAINIDGTGFTNLYSFSPLSAPPYRNGTNSDGADPYAGLILSSNTLYGTTLDGGSSGNGTVFKVNTDGTGFTNLYTFTYGSDGAGPKAGLVLSGNTLYGTAQLGGLPSPIGTVFKVNTNGTGFMTLHDFYCYYDGCAPTARLVLSGNTLYGTTLDGGNSENASSANGSVFKVNTDSTGFTNLHSFAASKTNFSGVYTNREGANPYAGLLLSGSTLYGAAQAGGSSGNGTVFALNTNGSWFTILHTFTASNTNSSGLLTNSDGAIPDAGLILTNNTLYGTASGGGEFGQGTVFSLSFTPQLTITPSGASVILSWPTNVAGFDYTGYTLQSAPALIGTFTNLLPGTSPYTNPIVAPQQFYRLSQ